jgi:hypothetical protein
MIRSTSMIHTSVVAATCLVVYFTTPRALAKQQMFISMRQDGGTVAVATLLRAPGDGRRFPLDRMMRFIYWGRPL